MHPVYHTDAIVIKSTSVGEANKRVWLFTREFGYIMALVQGVRKSGAKLQSHISDYSVIHADLVKGRAVWRLVSARMLENPLTSNTRSPFARGYVRTLAAIDRFLVGDGADEKVFAHLRDCARFVMEQGSAGLGAGESASFAQKGFDTISLWRLLAMLGHVAVEPEDERLATVPIAEALALADEKTIKRLIAAVNEAIEQSQL